MKIRIKIKTPKGQARNFSSNVITKMRLGLYKGKEFEVGKDKEYIIYEYEGTESQINKLKKKAQKFMKKNKANLHNRQVVKALEGLHPAEKKEFLEVFDNQVQIIDVLDTEVLESSP